MSFSQFKAAIAVCAAAAAALVGPLAAQQPRTLKMQSSFPKFSATPGSVRRPAPSSVGQHNAEIYGELLGLGATELEAMANQGII